MGPGAKWFKYVEAPMSTGLPPMNLRTFFLAVCVWAGWGTAHAAHVEEFYASGDIHIRHEVLAVYSYADVVRVRGRAVGTFSAPGEKTVQSFETHNLFVFRRTAAGNLQVWRIIYND